MLRSKENLEPSSCPVGTESFLKCQTTHITRPCGLDRSKPELGSQASQANLDQDPGLPPRAAQTL